MPKGQRFEYYPGFENREKAWRFYYASFRGGADYLDSADVRGYSVLQRHDKETSSGYNWRSKVATYPNYCRQIIQRYVDAVFSETAERMDNPRFLEWAANVDRTGNDLNRYMRLSTELMCGIGVYWTAVDARQLDVDNPSKAEASNPDNWPYLRRLYPWSIVGLNHDGGRLQWVVEHHIVSTQDSPFAEPVEKHIYRLWDKTTWTEYEAETEGGDVTLVGDGRHTFKDVDGEPIVPFFEHIYHQTEPFHGDSQLLDIAEANKKIFNLSSLLDEELFKNTITTLWATGCAAEGFSGDKGPDNLYFLEAEGADVKTVGAMASQAESIREAIALHVKEIYRLSGLTGGDPTDKKAAESGEAKARDLEQVYAGCKRIADGAERTENAILGTVCQHLGVKFENTDYPDTFDLASLEEELQRGMDMMSLPITSRLAEAEQVKKIYVKMHPKAENLKEMLTEVDEKAAEPEPEVTLTPPPDEEPEEEEEE